ncbi:MAG TPA: FAD-dependent oxidoreductase [Actinophytocola sp.]|jgi:D-arginine dehydrogenase|uniref:NAD(P)/FAD-dependent oxidoreductase n=1 Tax=Actinophytocola sp. TaxID=1872138 RepID=UPI002F94FF7C
MAEVLVVGGGMAGISIAYELAAHARVVLVEAEPTLAAHTTGRSAAIFAPSYGGPVVRALTVASAPRYRALQTELDTPPLLTERLVVWLGADEEGAAHLEKLPAEPITPAQARRLCPVLRQVVAAGRDDGASDIDVMALHDGYRRGLRERGGTIRTGHRVTAIARDGAGWRVTADEELTADVVVDAAGAWADEVATRARVPTVGLRPLRRTAAIASGTQPIDPGWPLVADAANRYYFRPEGERLLISPSDETPSEPCDAKPDELDVALAMERINEHTTLGLRRVHTAWAGLRSFVADRAPVVGEWPGHPGFAFFAGQGGYGIQMAPALAAYGAALVLGRSVPGDIDVAARDVLPGRSAN